MEKNYQTLIVDDDPLIIAQLEGFLAQTNLFGKPHTARNGTEAVGILHNSPIDLLFVDLELPDMNGLDFLRLFPNRFSAIIISAFPRYAVDCYDCDDIADFLVKPLLYPRFLRSLHRTVLRAEVPSPSIPVASNGSDTPVRFNQPGQPHSPSSIAHIYLKTGRINQRFTFNDILYLEAYTIYTKLISTAGTFVINEQISKLEKEFSQNNFLRVHKSYLINVNQVTRFSATSIWLQQHTVPVGRTFKPKVQAHLNSTFSSSDASDALASYP